MRWIVLGLSVCLSACSSNGSSERDGGRDARRPSEDGGRTDTGAPCYGRTDTDINFGDPMSWPIYDGCNWCYCDRGSLSCTARACRDGGFVDVWSGDSGDRDAALPSTPTIECDGSESNLPGVTIEFRDQVTEVTQAEALDGWFLLYDVIVDTSIVVRPYPQDAGGCALDDESGLRVFEHWHGNDQSTCECDQGLCGSSPELVPIENGSYSQSARWAGRNWSGPSDTGMPMGDPFPPGDYTLTVSAVGQFVDGPYRVCATQTFRVLP